MTQNKSMQRVEFSNHPTPLEISKALKVPVGSILEKLQGHHPVFPKGKMEETSILSWRDTQKICKTHGMEAAKGKSFEKDQLPLSKREREVLRDCEKFHEKYAAFLEESERVDKKIADKLAGHHRESAKAIQGLLARSINRKKPEEPTIGM